MADREGSDGFLITSEHGAEKRDETGRSAHKRNTEKRGDAATAKRAKKDPKAASSSAPPAIFLIPPCDPGEGAADSGCTCPQPIRPRSSGQGESPIIGQQGAYDEERNFSATQDYTMKNQIKPADK
ncbi:UNVERIFIED_CONTAM: hypothetical protein K2H54_058247 [Gekko kuhli]